MATVLTIAACIFVVFLIAIAWAISRPPDSNPAFDEWLNSTQSPTDEEVAKVIEKELMKRYKKQGLI